MWQNLVTFVITTKQIKRFKNPIPMSKDTSLISEIDKYFKNNDATSAMNKIMEITRALNFSEKRLYGEESRYNCKYSQTVGSHVQRSSSSLLPAIASVTTLV